MTTLWKLAGALSVLASSSALVACGGGDDGGASSACEGAYLLGEADAISYQKLSVMLDNYLSGAQIHAHRDRVRFKVPDDATGVHFTLEQPGGTPFVLQVYADGKLVSSVWEGAKPISKTLFTYGETVSFNLPNNQTLSPAGKCIEIEVGGVDKSNGGNVEIHTVTNTLRDKQLLLPVNIAVPDAMDYALDALEPFMELVSDSLDSLAGVGFAGPIGAYTLSDTPASFAVESDTFESVMGAVYADDFRLNVVLVESLSVEGLAEGYSLLGIAGGVPAAPFSGTAGSSLLVAMEPHLNADGESLNVDALLSTTIHEIGHMLGLFHTTESEGDDFDPISDTPECPAKSFDKNDDGLVTFSECAGRDGYNLMFWEGTQNAPTLSTTQRSIIQNAVLVR